MYDPEVGGSMALTQNVNSSNPEDWGVGWGGGGSGGRSRVWSLDKDSSRGVNLGLIHIEKVGKHTCVSRTQFRDNQQLNVPEKK